MMWVERWWLVIPSLDRQFHFGVTEIAVTVAFLAAFVLSISRFNQKIPHMYFDAKEPL
jgi:hypothetical protein